MTLLAVSLNGVVLPVKRTQSGFSVEYERFRWLSSDPDKLLEILRKRVDAEVRGHRSTEV